MTKKSHKEIGNEGEELACAYLETKGWTIVDRNYFFEHAEVDIVAFDDTTVVFVEVKLRSSTKFGQPMEYVTEEKVQNVFKAAEAWIFERKMDGYPMRFDIVGIVQKGEEAPNFNHIEDAFR